MAFASAFDFVLDTNKDGSNQKSGLTQSSSSELEIRNLLKQVELQVANKKLKWEKQKHESEHRLRVKEQELHKLETTLQEKDAQIEHLRNLLDDMDHTTQKIIAKCQQEMKALEDELSRVRLEYTIIQKKYKKATSRSGAPPTEPGDAGRNADDDVQLINTATAVTSNHHQFYHDSRQKATLTDVDLNNNPIGSAMNRRPSTKNLAQQQQQQRRVESPSNVALGQVNTLKRHGSSSKLAVHSSTPPPTTSNLMQIQQDEIAQLRAQLEEQKKLGNQLNEEKEKAIQNVDQYKSLYMTVVKKLESQSSPPSNLADPSSPASNDKFNISFLRQEIAKRDNLIKELKVTNRASSIELQFLKDELKKYQRQSEVVAIELERLKRDQAETLKKFDLLELENQQLKTREKANEESLRAAELLKKKYEIEKNNLVQELNILRHEINSHSIEMTEKSNKIRSLTERASFLEKTIEDGKLKSEKAAHELAMTTAQLDSLRLENHFLKQACDSKPNDKEVIELRKSFDQSEKENKRLRNEVIGLTKRLEAVANQEHGLGRRSHNSLADAQSEFIREEYEKKLEAQRKGFESEIKRMNHEKDKVSNENHYLRAELDHYKNRMQHMDSDDKVQEKLISFDSHLSHSNFSDFARMSSASYHSNHQHELLFQENLSGNNQRLKSQSSSASKIPHLRSMQNLRDLHSDTSPSGRSVRNPNDLKKQKRMLENVYDDYIEKIRGPSN